MMITASSAFTCGCSANSKGGDAAVPPDAGTVDRPAGTADARSPSADIRRELSTSDAFDASPDVQVDQGCPPPTADCLNNGQCSTNVSNNQLHCGGCRQPCTSDEACVAKQCFGWLHKGGVCSLVAQGSVTFAAVDTHSGIKVLKIGDSDAAVTELGVVAVKQTCTPIAVDSSHVYLVTSPAEGGSAVLRIDRVGGSFEVVSQETDGSLKTEGIAIDGAKVYWLGSRGVYRAPIQGGPAELWIKYLGIARLAIVDHVAYISFKNYSSYMGTRLRYRPTHLGPELDYQVAAVPGVTIPPEQHKLGTFVVSSTHVHWPVGSEIRRMPKGGGPVTSLDTGAMYIRELVMDGAGLLFIGEDANDPLIGRVQQGARAPQHIVTGSWNAPKRPLAVSNAWIYWHDWGYLRRIPR
jgi:hypothetical protein